MLQFPLQELLDERRCYEYLLKGLPPQGLPCPHGHLLPEGQQPPDRPREPRMESINNPGEQLISQLSGTRYLVVFQARAFSPPPTC